MGHATPAHRPSAADPATGHVDHDRQRTQCPGRFDGSAHGVVIVHVAADADGTVTQFLGQLAGPVGIGSKTATRIPMSTNRRTVAAPRPPAPPVTMAERPSNSIRWFPFPCRGGHGLLPTASGPRSLGDRPVERPIRAPVPASSPVPGATITPLCVVYNLTSGKVTHRSHF